MAIFKRSTPQELYDRIFAEQVALGKFDAAIKKFAQAAKRATKVGDSKLKVRAEANALLYQYLDKDKSDAKLITLLLQALQNLEAEGIKQIEKIGTIPTKMMSTAPLVAELECRLIESAIATTNEQDYVKQRDLHKDAYDKLLNADSNLITYQYISAAGPIDTAENRRSYHIGIHHYYDAMTQKEVDLSAAIASLAEAETSFEQYNDRQWLPHVSKLLNNWRQTRTCWVCGREIQGYTLHISMYPAQVNPYFKTLLTQEQKDTVNVEDHKIAVCIACYSMIERKAQEEADIVHQTLNPKLEEATKKIQSLESEVSDLQWRVSNLESQVNGLQSQVSSLES